MGRVSGALEAAIKRRLPALQSHVARELAKRDAGAALTAEQTEKLAKLPALRAELTLLEEQLAAL